MLLPLAILLPSLSAAESGRLYGTVVLQDDREFSGALRWDDEHVFWTDHLEADRPAPPDLSELSEDDQDAIYDNQPGPQIRLGDTTIEFIKLFGSGELRAQEVAVEFGGLAEVTRADGDVALVLRDGTRILVERGDGLDHIDVQLRTDDGSEHDFDGDEIKRVVFSKESDAPARFENHLYGTVETTSGSFTGTVQWDHDERFFSERLDGEDDDGDEISIDFGNIRAIKKDGDDGSLVETKDGTVRRLVGTNDVDENMRGIYVDVAGLGRVDIYWNTFISLQLADSEPAGLPVYADYAHIGALQGTVKSRDGKQTEGRLTIDIDESTTAEMISGWDEEGVGYFIPLHHIAVIRPNEGESELELRDGRRVTLSRDRDVNHKNNGVIIRGGSTPLYLPWANVAEIRLPEPTPAQPDS